MSELFFYTTRLKLGDAMQKLLTELKKQLSKGQDTMIVTIVASDGATPRGAGARMLVGSEGRICGTIGGGSVEFRSEQLALDALKNQTSQIKHFELNNKDVENLGMICGGDVTVYFRFINGKDAAIASLCDTALEQFAERKTSWLITELTDGVDGLIGLYSEKLGLVGIEDSDIIPFIKDITNTFSINNKLYYVEQMLSSGYVYIYGGGHVAQELVPILNRLNFRCIIHEDRAEFLKPELFEGAFAIRKVAFDNLGPLKEITKDDYIVVMTRGHGFDQVVQEQMLNTPAKYIGVIGSAAKVAQVKQNIMSHGYSKEDVDRIITPIGLMNVKGNTPAEISISIAGQLITMRTTGELLR